MLPESHQRQIARDRAAGLVRAGIGKTYHGRKLAELGPKGEQLAAWILDDGVEEVRTHGKGWTLTGPGASAYDAVILTARGLFVRGVSVRVLPLRRLVALIEHRTEDLAFAETCDALCITDFVQRYAGGILPLTGWEITGVEEFIGARLDNQRSVFLHAVEPLIMRESGWWSGHLLQRVARLNRHLAFSEEAR